MPIITCDIRNGRTKEQKHELAIGLTNVVAEATGCGNRQYLPRNKGDAGIRLRRCRRARTRLCPRTGRDRSRRP